MFEEYCRVSPQAIQIEHSVLGQLLVEKSAIQKVKHLLDPVIFCKNENKTICEIMLIMLEKSIPINTLTLVQELRDSGKIEEVGGVKYITSLTRRILSASEIEVYVEKLIEKHIQRQLIENNVIQQKLVWEDDCNVIDVMQQQNKQNEQLLQKIAGLTKINKSIKDLAFASMNTYYKLKEGKNEHKYKINIAKFDENVLFEKGDLIILAGRPGMGKTAFALQMARGFEASGNKTLFISLEMTAQKLISRILIAEANIDNKRFRYGNLNCEEEERLKLALDNVIKLNINIDDEPSQSVAKIESKILINNPDVVIIDYLGLIPLPNKSTRNEELGLVSSGLKSIAKKINIPIVALHQLSRGTERQSNKRPMLSDLRESGHLEQDADIVLLLYRDDYYDFRAENLNIEIIVAKYREGSRGSIELSKDYQLSNFSSVQKEFINYKPNF